MLFSLLYGSKPRLIPTPAITNRDKNRYFRKKVRKKLQKREYEAIPVGIKRLTSTVPQ